MPYTVKKNEKGEFCVYKKDEDGEATGESLGCHESKEKASAQIGAIESEEKPTKKSGEPNTEKGQSLDQLRWKIVGAWEDLYEYSMWVSEVFHEDGYIIVNDSRGKTNYKVPYTESDESVEFAPRNEWIEVKLNADWVEKFASLKNRMNYKDFTISEEDVTFEIDPKYAVKSLGENRLGAYGILWGDEDNKDLHKEWFDQETRDIKSIFSAMGKLPLIVHHAADEDVKSFVYGEVDVLEEDDTGLWWEAKIKEFETYRKYVQPLLDRRAMFSSSGTLPAAKRVEKSGRITRWPVAEMTTTWIPAEWRMLERPVDEIKAAYKAIDLNYDFTDVEDEDNDAIGAAKARLSLIADSYLREIELIEETL